MNNVKTMFAAVGLVTLLIWLAVEAQAQAETPYSMISATLTPFVPTSTPVPTAQPTLTPTPVPEQTVTIRPLKRFVYFPTIRK